MRPLLDAILRRTIVRGSLRVIYPDGAAVTFSGQPGAHAAMRLTDPAAVRRIAADRAAIADLYDERFCRMFEFSLSGCEVAFRREGHMAWQMQLAREHAAVPLTRDYVVDGERAVAEMTQAAWAQAGRPGLSPLSTGVHRLAS